MAEKSFLDMTLTEATAHVKKEIQLDNLNKRHIAWQERYHAKYIKTGRFTPVWHASVIVAILGYATLYPSNKDHGLRKYY